MTDLSKEARYIRVIKQAGNISAAADDLGISQPALSARLKKTESQLGVQLFDRSHVPLALTDAGDLFLEYAARADELDREFIQRLSDIERLQTGRLVVGGATSFNISYLAKTIALFSQRYPGIEVTVVDDTAPALAAAALNGSIDVFVSPLMNREDEFVCEELLVERVFLCVPPTWSIVDDLPAPHEGRPYAEIGVEDFAKLADHPFVVLHESQQIGQMLRSLFEKYDLAPKRAIAVEQTLTGLALTLSGAGISFVPAGTLEVGCYHEKPALYLFDEGLSSRTLYVMHCKNHYTSRAVTEFIELLRKTHKNVS